MSVIVKGKLVGCQDLKTSKDKPFIQLQVLGQTSRGADLYKVDDYDQKGRALQIGSEVELDVVVSSYVKNNQARINYMLNAIIGNNGAGPAERKGIMK